MYHQNFIIFEKNIKLYINLRAKKLKMRIIKLLLLSSIMLEFCFGYILFIAEMNVFIISD